MSSIDIRHIVFDIGKVLIHYDPNLPYSRLVPDEAERSWFFANVCTSDWNIEQDRGRSWEEAEAILIRNHPEREDHIRAFRRHWHEMVPHAYVETVAIMGGLIADGWDVTMLTNFASDTFREAQKLYPFLTLPRGVTVSGDVSAHQARSRHLPDPRRGLRPRSGRDALHRRQRRQCRRRASGRLARGSVHRRRKAESRSRGLRYPAFGRGTLAGSGCHAVIG